MRPHQGQAELLDLFEKLLYSFVFGDPCPYLREQIFGDINGACLVPGDTEGHMLPCMERPAMVTAAGRPAATMAVGVEGGGQDDGARGHLLEAAIEHAADGSGVIGDGHGRHDT